MSEVSWTKEQQQVIDVRNRNVLVSAAAGSGKTAVLVERIIKRITEETNRIHIDHLLVVTFTKAAAGEMRERIGKALEEIILKQPDNKHLQKQLALIHTAQITTIDSFCLYVIRNYFHTIHLDPAFRIAEEAELTLLKADVLKEVLEEQYFEQSQGFLDFVESYGTNKSDASIEEYIRKLHEFSMSYPWPREWLCSLKSDFVSENSISDHSEWMRFLIGYIKQMVLSACKLNQRAIDLATKNGGPIAYVDALNHDNALLDMLLKAETYQEYATVFEYMSFTALSRKKQEGVSDEDKEQVKQTRQEMKDLLQGLKKDFFFQSYSEMSSDMRHTKTTMLYFIQLVILFQEKYAEKKREKNILDFHDLEHLTLDILVHKTDGMEVRSQAAIELSRQFDEIMIDEYQDSNEVQEKILTSISREQNGCPNIFMVGDVKQSIYKFRLAKPELFMEKYETYTTQDSKHQRIDLYYNFRSRAEVLDSANEICKKIMTKELGGINYDDKAALYYGAQYLSPKEEDKNLSTEEGSKSFEREQRKTTDQFIPTNNQLSQEKTKLYQTEILILDRNNVECAAAFGDDSQSQNIGFEDSLEEEYTVRELEAKMIARRIHQFVDEREGLLIQKKRKKASHEGGIISHDQEECYLTRAKYGDIVILLRTMSGWSDVFTNILLQEGIPAYADIQSGYFQTIEVKTVLNMLRILDNPRQDIPFTAVLYSGIADIKSEGLAMLRSENYKETFLPRQHCIYELARKYSIEGENISLKEQLRLFFRKYDDLRERIPYTAIHQLLLDIYQITGYDSFVYAMPSGERRRQNLQMLVERAIDFEATSFHGLFQFVRYIEKLIKYEIDYGEAMEGGERENAVRILSIHKSKGLEFPIVFLGGMGKQFNNADIRSKIVLHSDYGIGADCVDYQMRTKIATLRKKAIQKKLVLDNLGEELRILYVALTRAKEKLIMTGVVKDLQKELVYWQEQSKFAGNNLLYSTLVKAMCYFDFVGPVIVNTAQIQWKEISYRELIEREERVLRNQLSFQDEINQLELELKEDKGFHQQLTKQLKYSYTFIKDAKLPMKTTVSELKKMSQSTEDSQEFYIDHGNQSAPADEGTSSHEAALRGTLYHKLLEVLPIKNYENETDLAREIDILNSQGRLGDAKLHCIELSSLFKFYKTPLANKMMLADQQNKLFREQRFVMGIPSNEIYPESTGEELVLIQGMMDAYYEEDEKYVLVDYKTDHVNLQNGEKVLADRYKLQLSFYARAIEQFTGKEVKERHIYSFALDKDILV